MLVLGRKVGEQIRIGQHISVTVLAVRGKSVRLGLVAPEDVGILREELSRPHQPFDGEDDPPRPEG